MLYGEREQKVRLEMAQNRSTGLVLSGALAAIGAGMIFTTDPSYSVVVFLIIAAINIGTYFEDKRKLRLAFKQDLDEKYGAPPQ